MARRSSKPEEEKDAGNPVEPTESIPEQDLSSHVGEKGPEANTLVQAPLRDAYMENAEDLHFLPKKLPKSKHQMNLCPAAAMVRKFRFRYFALRPQLVAALLQFFQSIRFFGILLLRFHQDVPPTGN